MAIIKAVNSRASIARAIQYITKTEKTEIRLIGGQNCDPVYAIEEMNATKKRWNKEGKRQYKHFIQSFSAKDAITPEKAHEIAREVVIRCKLFQGFEVCYATHKDREHIHTHFIVNSVSFETGKKLHQSKWDLQAIKDLSDEVIVRNGFEICEKNREITAFQIGAYRSIEKAVQGKYQSWMLEIAKAVVAAAGVATSRAEFKQLLQREGVDTEWKDNRIYIVFVHTDGKRARATTLASTFKLKLSKEELENEFAKNYRARTQTADRPAQGRGGAELCDRAADTRKRRIEGGIDELQRRHRAVQEADLGVFTSVEGDIDRESGRAENEQRCDAGLPARDHRAILHKDEYER